MSLFTHVLFPRRQFVLSHTYTSGLGRITNNTNIMFNAPATRPLATTAQRVVRGARTARTRYVYYYVIVYITSLLFNKF